MRFLALVCLLFLVALSSCEKAEDPFILPPAPQDSAVSVTANLGSKYNKVVYYKLATKQATVFDINAYDLAFESAGDAFRLWLNSGKYMFVWKTESKNLNETFDISTAKWRLDVPDYNPDSSAFGVWLDESTRISDSSVYILDRGKLFHANKDDRYFKIQLLSVSKTEYHFRYAKLNDVDFKDFTIVKNSAYSYVHFHFDNNGQQVVAEPPKDQWDGVIKQYTAILYDQPPLFRNYLVRGWLNNRLAGVTAAEVTKNKANWPVFEACNFDKLNLYTFKPEADLIGFDWKTFNLNAGDNYTLEKGWYYLVKDPSGAYYKIEFVGFYDQNGAPGAIQFDYQAL